LFSIKTLPMMAFENLNSLEILNLQNNKLTRVPEEALEAIVDTATVIDIMGKSTDMQPTLIPDPPTHLSKESHAKYKTYNNKYEL
jgi:hypothetical protein